MESLNHLVVILASLITPMAIPILILWINHIGRDPSIAEKTRDLKDLREVDLQYLRGKIENE